MRAPHPPEFRTRAVESAREGATPVAELAKQLGVSNSDFLGRERTANQVVVRARDEEVLTH
jgi:transposase-like protein